jgi:hypothetical protein
MSGVILQMTIQQQASVILLLPLFTKSWEIEIHRYHLFLDGCLQI